MSYELMIPEEVPSYILNPELAKQANEDVLFGISAGALPRIKLSGKQFTLVNSNGEETPVRPADMFQAPNGNLYLLIIVLRVKREVQKSWYASKYNPNEEGRTPDCFSNDGVTPDPLAPSKQCETCANCQYNAYGSGKDQNGNPTNGKACSDNKIAAVFVPKVGVHKFKVPPASIKNLGAYVRELNKRGISIGNVKTLVGFDLKATFPVLTFEFGGFVPEPLLPQLAEMAQSSDAEEIANDRITPSAGSLPAPKTQEAPKTYPAPAPAQQEADDLGLGVAAEPQAKPEPKQEAAPVDLGPSDDELAKELGLL